jgi:hypothetical protein
MCRLLTSALLVCLGIASVNASHAQGARLYKWVDEHGNIHYSDRVEGSSAQHRPQTINSHGIQIATDSGNARPMSADERRQEREARRTSQLDTMLLANYQSEIELLRAHDESRASIESGIRALEESLTRIRRQLAERELRHDVAANDPHVSRLRQQVLEAEGDLERMRARRFELYERQNREVARFRELTMNNG